MILLDNLTVQNRLVLSLLKSAFIRGGSRKFSKIVRHFENAGKMGGAAVPSAPPLNPPMFIIHQGNDNDRPSISPHCTANCRLPAPVT